MKKENKLYIVIFSIILITISVLTIFATAKQNKQQELTCTYEHKNHTITQHLTYTNKEWHINLNHTYVYENTDNTVDKYEVYKKYLEILETNLNVKTSITQEEYTVKYEISGKLNDFTDETLTPTEIQKLLKFTNIDEFQRYFEDSKYICN